MQIRGVVQSAALEENPAAAGAIEMIVKVQGVGPGQPRKLVVPYEMLLENENLDPETIVGRGFDAEVEQAADSRWMVARIDFAGRVLRPSE